MGKIACLEPSYALRDFETFSNCFYSWITDTTTTAATPDHSVVPSVSVDSPFGDLIYTCLMDYCNSTDNGCAVFVDRDQFYQLGLQPRVCFISEACDVSKNDMIIEVNADIAGPGVCFLFITCPIYPPLPIALYVMLSPPETS